MTTPEGHKIFVGDLPPDISQEELQTVFSTYGEVNGIHILNPQAKSGMRCALLYYSKPESAEDAIKVLNGVYKIREDAVNPIKVQWAKEKSSGGDAAGGRVQESDGYKLFVGGLPLDVKDDELKLVFGTYGEVNRVHILPPKEGSTRIAAFIFYARSESGDDAISVLNDKYKIRADADQAIQVRWGVSKDKGSGKGDWNPWGGQDWNSWGGGGKGGWSGGGSGGGGDGGKMKAPEGWKLFVGGLPQDCTEDELNSVFTTYGSVNKVHVMPPHNMSGRVAAFVYYNDDKAADDAIKVLNGVYKIREDAEAPIQVRWASDRQSKGGDKGGGSWGGYDSWGGGKGKGGGGKGGGKQAIGWQDNSGWGGGGSWNSKGGDNWSGGWGGTAGGWDGGSGYGGKGGGGGGGGGKGGPPSDTKLFVGNLPEDVTEDALNYVFSTYGKVSNVHVMKGKSKTGNACAFVEFTSGGDADTAIMTLHEKYEIKPGSGTILVKKANTGQRSRPY